MFLTPTATPTTPKIANYLLDKLGFKSEESMCNKVDFPLPLTPTIAIDSRACNSKEISLKRG